MLGFRLAGNGRGKRGVWKDELCFGQLELIWRLPREMELTTKSFSMKPLDTFSILADPTLAATTSKIPSDVSIVRLKSPPEEKRVFRTVL